MGLLHIFGRIGGRKIDSSALCSLVSIRCHSVVSVLPSTDSFSSLSFEFRCPLSNRKRTNIMDMLLLLRGVGMSKFEVLILPGFSP